MQKITNGKRRQLNTLHHVVAIKHDIHIVTLIFTIANDPFK